MEKCKIISTGSHGNCEIYHGCIAIDMGVPYITIKPHLKGIKLVLLSHVHIDHFNIATIRKIAFNRPTIRFGCGPWMKEHLQGIKNVDVYELNKWYDYGQFKISIGMLFHDVENCFFRIEKNGYRIFRATDTAHLEGISAKDYDLYAIEGNYDEETIEQKIQERIQKGEYSYQKDSFNTHLSQQQALDFFVKNKKESSVLIRLHESRNI